MAIVKNNFRVSRVDSDFSEGSRDSVSGEDEDELRTESMASRSDGSDMFEVDSGMESDECDLLELGEAGLEFCQLGSHSCMLPFDLYDLPDLTSVLSVDTWNSCLTEDERFALAEFLPDIDQETFVVTLTELFTASNFHFCSPLTAFFNRLKGGLCEPRVDLYRQGLNSFQRREHYHLLRKYQDSMVGRLVQIRDAWENCAGYGIEERLRLLNILRSQKTLGCEKERDLDSETNSDSEEIVEGLWNKKIKMDHQVAYPRKPSSDIFSCRSNMVLEAAKYVEENPKGMLKVASAKGPFKKYNGKVGRFSSSPTHGSGTKNRPPLSLSALPRHDKLAGFDVGTAQRRRSQIRDNVDDDELDGEDYAMNMRGSTLDLPRFLRPGKKQTFMKRLGRYADTEFEDEGPEGYAELRSFGRNRADEMVTIASYDSHSQDALNNPRYSERDWNNPLKDHIRNLVPKGANVDQIQPFRHKKAQEEAISTDRLVAYDDWNAVRKKWKAGKNPKVKSQKLANPNLYSDSVTKKSHDKFQRKSFQNGAVDLDYPRSGAVFRQSEETESDSSDHDEEEGSISPLPGKLVYPSGHLENRQSAAAKSAYDPQRNKKLVKKGKNAYARYEERDTLSCMPEVDMYQSKGKQKVKTSGSSYLRGHPNQNLSASGKSVDDQKQPSRLLKKHQMQGHVSDRLQLPSPKTYSTDKKRKLLADPANLAPHHGYKHDYASDMFEEGEDEGIDRTFKSMDAQPRVNKTWNRGQVTKAYPVEDDHESLNVPLLGCNSVMRKRKGKVDGTYVDDLDEAEYLQTSPKKQPDGLSLMKKKGKRKSDGTALLPLVTPELVNSETGIADMEPEARLPKKPFTLITPTVHSGFSFSVIHLLSAIRKAMITIMAEDATEVGNHLDKNDARHKPKVEDNGLNSSEGHKNLPSLTVQEIVNRVRLNPGDPCILETQEPLQDLVRGVLKIFSSKTAPLGAKGWKALVSYEKATKSWSWIGPVSSISSDHDVVEEETSSEAWSIPHKMLVKLVDAFANWLKSGQETLQQIGSLPAPPVMVSPLLDEKERFRDLRAQKSLLTISTSSDEVRAYFRREELLRYTIPDRAFSYTAADGKKSIVAPLRRGGGKPTSKARDHFMLKPDRPPHVTILCLVRDAAARLPGSIGTRADVCTLIRDSQYIVEDVSDSQVNQVVSGALDRLHYERDPCVQFDGERKLWVYLHRDREEQDFEDDGTSSTKKWKRQRKDTPDHDIGLVSDMGYHGAGDEAAVGSSANYDFNCDPNLDSASIHAGQKTEVVYDELRPNAENMEPLIDSMQANLHQGHPMGWEVLGLDPLRENKMLCQENSTNEDFDDETYSKERPFLSARFL